MDWFEALTGFTETTYGETKERLFVADGRLHSSVNGASYGIGHLELLSLGQLREQTSSCTGMEGSFQSSITIGDVRELHQHPEHSGALFQVASQFNLLEMIGHDVTPEHGVTRYQYDRTQGPACAIAAGAGTIYRNYFVPVGDQFGQTTQVQLDGLSDIGVALCGATHRTLDQLWDMRNGYALCTRSGLEAINNHLEGLEEDQIDLLRSKLRIGLHWDVEVTQGEGPDRPFVTQAFCSALPVTYSGLPSDQWEPFARLVLEAAYEATILASVLNAGRTGSNIVFLTLLGGGAFGNQMEWITDAISRSLELASGFDLDVRLVSYDEPSEEVVKVMRKF